MKKITINLILLSSLFLSACSLKTNQTSVTQTSTTSTTQAPTALITPKYSVTILNKPDFSKNLIEINAVVKNIGITPFITHFTYGNCKFIDNSNNTYTGGSRNSIEYTFDKALLPNESATVNLKGISIYIDKVSGYMATNFGKCDYDKQGNYVCIPIKGIRITSCEANISIDTGFPDRNIRKYILNVEFPN